MTAARIKIPTNAELAAIFEKRHKVDNPEIRQPIAQPVVPNSAQFDVLALEMLNGNGYIVGMQYEGSRTLDTNEINFAHAIRYHPDELPTKQSIVASLDERFGLPNKDKAVEEIDLNTPLKRVYAHYLMNLDLAHFEKSPVLQVIMDMVGAKRTIRQDGVYDTEEADKLTTRLANKFFRQTPEYCDAEGDYIVPGTLPFIPHNLCGFKGKWTGVEVMSALDAVVFPYLVETGANATPITDDVIAEFSQEWDKTPEEIREAFETYRISTKERALEMYSSSAVNIFHTWETQTTAEELEEAGLLLLDDEIVYGAGLNSRFYESLEDGRATTTGDDLQEWGVTLKQLGIDDMSLCSGKGGDLERQRKRINYSSRLFANIARDVDSHSLDKTIRNYFQLDTTGSGIPLRYNADMVNAQVIASRLLIAAATDDSQSIGDLVDGAKALLSEKIKNKTYGAAWGGLHKKGKYELVKQALTSINDEGDTRQTKEDRQYTLVEACLKAGLLAPDHTADDIVDELKQDPAYANAAQYISNWIQDTDVADKPEYKKIE